MPETNSPHAPEGASQLYAALGDAERRELNALHEQVRTFVRTTLATIKTVTDPTQQRDGVVSLHLGAADLLHTLTSGAYDSAVAAQEIGPVACAKGCASCCYLSIEVSVPAAIAVAAYVESVRPDLKAGAIAAVSKIAGVTHAARAALQVPCPYLQDSACQVYDTRPLSCRSYYSFNRAACETYRDVPVYGLPRVLNSIITGGMSVAADDIGLQSCTVELIAATALILSDPTAIPRWLAGAQVFTPFR